MTRWAFLSDIHGNRPALDRALDQCRQLGVDRFAFLGDYLGHGDPDGVIQRIRELGDIAIVGNRDLDWADRVSASSGEYVRTLPRRVSDRIFTVAHGDPKLDRELNVNDLRRGAPKTFDALQAICTPLYLFGHTHHARIWTKQCREAEPRIHHAARLDLLEVPDGGIAIVNVGTIGKPFPGKGPASFTLLDDSPGGFVEHVLVAPP